MEGCLPAGENAYCYALGMRAPRLEDHARKGHIRPFHLMVLMLLERGQRLSVGEMARRLEELGLAPLPGLECSLLKAWHGLPPVFRDSQGLLGLDLGSRHLRFLLYYLGLKERANPIPPPPLPEMPPDTVPLTAAEVEAALGCPGASALSLLRGAAAVLDAHAASLTLEEMEARLGRLTGGRSFPAAARAWQSSSLLRTGGGLVALDRSSPHLYSMRRAVRRVAGPVLARRAREEGFARANASLQLTRATAEFRERLKAERMRRAVLHAAPDPIRPAAWTVLDPASRSMRTFLENEASSLLQHLGRFDLLAGLHMRETVEGLGLAADRWRLVDLGPPRKTRRLGRAGRTLKITPAMIISGSCGLGRPLGDPRRIAKYAGAGQVAKLVRRVESDAKALHALYRYGVLHRSVRLHWGLLDEMLHVEWALPGDPWLEDILRRAASEGKQVDLVIGSAPGWTDPWARALQYRVRDVERHMVLLEGPRGGEILRCHDIQAVRTADERELCGAGREREGA